MQDKPFALIGVNVSAFETKNLKERMDQEKMNWRSFAHQDAINAKWNPSTPSYYVLDPAGVIRHKWVGAPGEKALDQAVERLINESEDQDKQSISRNRTRRDMNEQASAWLTAIEGLPQVHDRLKRVVLLDRPVLEVIKSQDGPRTLFYCRQPAALFKTVARGALTVDAPGRGLQLRTGGQHDAQFRPTAAGGRW